MKETDLYNLFKPFIKWKSPYARIYTELDNRDVVVFEEKDDRIYISEFELKLSLNKELLKQMCSRDYYSRANYLYAVVPINKKNQERDLHHLFHRMGWGLITVNITLVKQFPEYAMSYCNIEVAPKVREVLEPHIEPQVSKLFEEIQNQAGGSVRTKKFTEFKADLENIYFALKGLKRPRSWRAIKAIMLKNAIVMPDHRLNHRLKCLSDWGVIEVTKRGRTSLYKDMKLGDKLVTDKILNGRYIK